MASKKVAALGAVPSGFTVPLVLCHRLSPNEQMRCVLAPHAPDTLHMGYLTEAAASANQTTTWR